MSNAEDTIRLAAVGDILLTQPLNGDAYARDERLIGDRLRQRLAECDVVFGNLECTLPGDGRTIPTEPRVVATPELVRRVKEAGFNVVTLANNHMFDCLEGGFKQVREVLADIGLPHFGAGMNLAEATAPHIIEAKGMRIAMIGAVDQRSGPYQFAGERQFGVAPFDVDGLTEQIRDLRAEADHVIVSVHWGEERFMIPAPDQMAAAGAMVDAGATLILGHHPHVIQGMETIRGVPVIYSLGNFIADDVHFTDGDTMRWNPMERTGAVLAAELTAGGVANIELLPTYDDGTLAELDKGGRGRRRIAKTAHAIRSGVTERRYRRERLWVQLVRPSLARLRPSKLLKLRPRNFLRAIQILLGRG